MKKVIPLLMLFPLIFACSQKVMINVTKPAQYNVSDIKRIAIFDFNGPANSGQLMSSKFINHLWKSQYFSIMERKELNKILDEHALQMSGIVNDSTVVEFGRILGVDGIIVGDVTAYNFSDRRGREKVKEKVWKGDYETDKNGNVIFVTEGRKKVKKKLYVEELVDRDFITRTVSFAAGFRLISVETGEIRASDSDSRSNSHKYYPHKDKLPSGDQMLDAMAESVVSRFIPLIAPYQVAVSKEFDEDNDQVDLGIEYAQKNLWDKAEQIWQAEADKDPQNSAAIFNLGIAAEVMGDLERAEQLYDQALSVEPKDLYMEALSNIRQRKIEQQKLMEQLH